MRNKKAFSFDEEKDAWKDIETKFYGGSIDYGKMYSIAKYFRKNFGYGEVRLEKKLIEFCKECDKNFNPIVESEYIKKWIKIALEYNLRKVSPISLTQKEIDFLKSIENQRDRKILFSTLILSKAIKQNGTKKKTGKQDNPNFYIHYSNIADIYRLMSIKNITEADVCDILHKYKNNFIFYSPNKELIRVEFIDASGDSKFLIEDFDDIPNIYNTLFGKPKSVCENCGKEFEKRANNQILCPECSKVRLREKKKIFMRKKRANEN